MRGACGCSSVRSVESAVLRDREVTCGRESQPHGCSAPVASSTVHYVLSVWIPGACPPLTRECTLTTREEQRRLFVLALAHTLALITELVSEPL